MVERPSKLETAMNMAEVVAERSHDAETKVGAILMKKDNGIIIATGCNGFVRGANDAKLPNTRPDKHDFVLHAEENILSHCARYGISVDACMLVCTHSPCKRCSRMLWQSGIEDVVCKELYRDFEQTSNMGDLEMHKKEMDDGFWHIRYTIA